MGVLSRLVVIEVKEVEYLRHAMGAEVSEIRRVSPRVRMD